MKKNLRLLVTKNCNRSCPGCCNKDWDLDNLPVFDIKDINKYNDIIITGGEPLLYTEKVIDLYTKIMEESFLGRIILYTAKTNIKANILAVGYLFDGLTITLHEQKDVENIKPLITYLNWLGFEGTSIRLNIFKGIDYSSLKLTTIKVQDNMEWIKDCPLPKNEIFMKYIIK